MPIGFNDRGLPLSITLIGKLYDEASILEAAKAYQGRTDHHKKHPAKIQHGVISIPRMEMTTRTEKI
jgi:hypothetical protein